MESGVKRQQRKKRIEIIKIIKFLSNTLILKAYFIN